MATRKVYLTVESGGYITNGKGEWVDFYVTSGGEAFGAYEPYAIEIDFSGVTSWHKDNVTHDWKIEISSDGEYGELGDNYITIGTFSKIMNRSNANFDLGYTSLTSTAISNLKSNGITNIGIFQDNTTRRIEGYSYASAVATIYYNEPSYDWNYGPSNVQVSQNNDGTFNASWNEASWSGPSPVYYYIYINGEEEQLWDGSETNIKNIFIPKKMYGKKIVIKVIAEESDSGDWTQRETSIEYTFQNPSLSIPQISISSNTGISLTINKIQGSSLSYCTGNIHYELHYGTIENSTKIEKFSGDSYTITESQLEEWNIINQSFFIKAIATITKPTGIIPNNTLEQNSNIVNFIYEPHKTVIYFTESGPQECIVHYYTGNPNEGNNGWVECEPYIYTGESNATIDGWQLCSYI